jgi:S1-C subfamily serine protease
MDNNLVRSVRSNVPDIHKDPKHPKNGSGNGFGKRVSSPFAKNSRALTVVAVLLVCGVTGFFGGWLGSRNHDVTTSLSASQGQKIVASQSQLVSSIAKAVSPSVVSVDVTSQTTSNSFFGFATPSQQQSAGTGMIISSDGLIMTNRHVVPAGTTNVSVTLSDGTTFDDVQVVGRTSESDSLDVAILKIGDTKGHTLTPVTFGDSSKMQVGDMVVAIGNALGQFQNTVTSGIISGYGRSVQAGDSGATSADAESLADLFQTDAAINEGNSGGPLVNTSGQVVGINTAIAANAQNIGFAIPINDVSGLIKNVIQTGKFERPFLGIQYISLTPDVAKQLNLNVTQGAYIPTTDQNNGQSPIFSGSPADKAGLQEKDVITEVDGTNVDQNHSLISLLGAHSVGDKVTLTVVRDGKTQSIDVTLDAAPSS